MPKPSKPRKTAVRCTGWLDALAKSWERRARNKKLYGEIYSQALRDCALELQIKTLRADAERASNDKLTHEAGDQRL